MLATCRQHLSNLSLLVLRMNLSPDPPIQRYHKSTHGGNSATDVSEYWVDALGQVAWFFAYLEWCSFEIVERLGSAADRDRLNKWGFSERTRRASLVLDRFLRSQDDALADEWKGLLGEILGTAEMRNQVLHNPLSLSFDRIDAGVGPEHGIRLMRDSSKRVVSLGAVQAFAAQLRVLNARLISLLARTSFEQQGVPE